MIAYVAGKGALKAKLLGLITVMAMPESTELSEGELMRYLAEAAWYPTALLPESGVEWEAVDAHLAKARLRDGERTVELIFTFDDEDHISSVYSDGRYRDGGNGSGGKDTLVWTFLELYSSEWCHYPPWMERSPGFFPKENTPTGKGILNRLNIILLRKSARPGLLVPDDCPRSIIKIDRHNYVLIL